MMLFKINLLYILIAFLLRKAVARTSFTLSVIPSNQPIYLGQEVILTCQLKGLKDPPNEYAVLFKRTEGAVSEKCSVYKPKKFRILCEPGGWGNATTFKLYINAVSWVDRGDWLCVYAANSTQQHLDVYARPTMEKMYVTSLPAPASSVDNQATKQPDDYSTGAAYDNVDRGNGVSGQMPLLGLGLGTRTNPYDLRRGNGLQLKCQTTCGHPRTNVTWKVGNSSYIITPPALSHVTSDAYCKGSVNTDNMTTTASTLNVYCDQFYLIGLNQIRCNAQGSQFRDVQLSRHVYIVCPDAEELRQLQKLRAQRLAQGSGEPPMQLTAGEVVGIVVGVALLLLIISVSCIMSHRMQQGSQLQQHGHIPGHRV